MISVATRKATEEKSRSADIHLDVDLVNVGATALYEKFGFQKVGQPYWTHYIPFQRRQHMIRHIK